MSSNSSEGLGGLLLLVTFCLFIWLSDWVPLRKEITTYDVICTEAPVDGQCGVTNQRAWTKVTYRPDRDTKTVVYWTDGQPPEKFDNCAIADVENWSCPGRYYSHQMVNGIFDSRSEEIGYPHQISKFRWWQLKFYQLGN